MSEATLWRYVSRGMRGRWHATRHEDRVATGIPDVSWAMKGCQGWLELKHSPKWPSATDGYVRFGHVPTPEQMTWLRCRNEHGGGHCFVLAQVGTTYLLLWPSLYLCEPRDEEWLRSAADQVWERRINWNEFERELTV